LRVYDCTSCTPNYNYFQGGKSLPPYNSTSILINFLNNIVVEIIEVLKSFLRD